eukprot:TRINITY_DN103575_c0_g1_i1.p1 TRINITY_DN103575_c0_g1~~TRINITY_DN103575_c0_g1_i1.p1  ORF type:complete len:314 (+),score=30.93 TRINITY_DN103575_c0_g1_i1:115-942(+)
MKAFLGYLEARGFSSVTNSKDYWLFIADHSVALDWYNWARKESYMVRPDPALSRNFTGVGFMSCWWDFSGGRRSLKKIFRDHGEVLTAGKQRWNAPFLPLGGGRKSEEETALFLADALAVAGHIAAGRTNGTLRAADAIAGCDESLKGDNGQGYRGCQDKTPSGRTCQDWAKQTPQAHMYKPASYPGEGLVSNYCRNPGAEGETIWCYTTDPTERWEYCDPVAPGVRSELEDATFTGITGEFSLRDADNWQRNPERTPLKLRCGQYRDTNQCPVS